MLRRITQHSEYLEFQRPALLIRGTHFHAATLPSPSEFAFGLTINKRIGKAHRRNLLKRRIKAWLQQRKDSLPQDCKINLIARVGAGELDWQELCRELNALLDRVSASRTGC